ncbi:unnamed protein product [Dicrocoelium dendriticum]|nr:unnamed protein product [Dicrocoelium dendriticum]
MLKPIFRSTTLPPLFFGFRFGSTYSDTINHPVFPFAIHSSPSTQSDVTSRWCAFFSRLTTDTTRPRFVLHDGPPYANGQLHIGHALNKFFKDVIIRQRILSGYSVSFVPGWDCHGLPIELKAKEHEHCSPHQTRESASAVARKYIAIQRSSFISWGILSDWNNYYTTMDHQFERTELDAFAALYYKGLVYRDLLPVHWSYRARTAVAESELEYNADHVSPSVYFVVRMHKLPNRFFRKIQTLANVYSAVWTTTPWTIPSNEAVLFDSDAVYVLLKTSSTGDFYIAAKAFTEQLASMLPTQLVLLDEFLGIELNGSTYIHPIRPFTLGDFSPKPFLPSTSQPFYPMIITEGWLSGDLNGVTNASPFMSFLRSPTEKEEMRFSAKHG